MNKVRLSWLALSNALRSVMQINDKVADGVSLALGLQGSLQEIATGSEFKFNRKLSESKIQLRVRVYAKG